MNPEMMTTITAGTTPVQMLILFCLGGIFMWGVFCFVRWLIQIKTRHLDSLPQDIKEIKEQLGQSAIELNSMNSKLWPENKIKAEVNAALDHHQMGCPAWQFHCRKEIKLIITTGTVLLLSGCAAMQEVSKSIALEIDWAGIWELATAYFTR